MGIKKKKLDEINTTILTSEEKAWYDLLVETTKGDGETHVDDVYSEKIRNFSESPLINWVGIGGTGLIGMAIWLFLKSFLKTHLLPTI